MSPTFLQSQSGECPRSRTLSLLLYLSPPLLALLPLWCGRQGIWMRWRRHPDLEQGGSGAAPAMSEWREEDDDGARCPGPRQRPRMLPRRSPLPRPAPAPANAPSSASAAQALAGARWTPPSPVTAGSAPRRRALDAPLAGAWWTRKCSGRAVAKSRVGEQQVHESTAWLCALATHI